MLRKLLPVQISLRAAILVVVLAALSFAQTIRISTYEALSNIGFGTPMDGEYELSQDIDASGRLHEPIGGYGSTPSAIQPARVFTGKLNGNGFTIRGLSSNRPDYDHVGLFGAIGDGAVITDLVIEVDSMVGKNQVGVVAGRTLGGGASVTVSNVNCIVNGIVRGSSDVGGLVGRSGGADFSICTFEGAVSGDSSVGGIIGAGSIGSLTQSIHFNGTVNGINNVGGLGGDVAGLIKRSSAAGTVSGIDNVGGLFGRYTTVPRQLGIISSHSTADVSGNVSVGGLVGYCDNSIDSSYATGSVSGERNVGGLVGWLEGNNGIRNVYAAGSVYGIRNIGGLVGLASNSSSNNNYNTIGNSYAVGSVTGDSATNVTSSHVGGLVGANEGMTIRQSYASGNLRASYLIGGLVGHNSGEAVIVNCYAVGNVFGRSSGNLGGLVGRNEGGSRVDSFYATGEVVYGSTSNEYVGGLVGYNVGSTVTASFFDSSTVKQEYVAGGGRGGMGVVIESEGLPTNAMRARVTYEAKGWDFNGIWATSGTHYPYLRSHQSQRFVYLSGPNGSVSGSIDQVVNLGAAQPVTAVPDPGQIFVGWDDGVRTLERHDRDLTVSEKTIRALFGIAYTLHYSSRPNGVIVGDTLQIVEAGANARRVTAVADDGYEFLRWSDDVETAARTDANVSADISVYPIFVEEGTSVRHLSARGGSRQLVSVRAGSLVVTAAEGAPVDVRVVNLSGRTVARFRSAGSANHSLRGLSAGTYIVEARRSGARFVLPITLR